MDISNALSTADTTAQYNLGQKKRTKNGNEYIYSVGVDACAAYDWVVIEGSSAEGGSYGSVTRVIDDDCGLVGIAQAAITANKYGWFLIKGVGWGNSGECAAGSPVFACGTTAVVSTTANAGHGIYNAVPMTASNSGGTSIFVVHYPYFPGTSNV